MLKPAHLPLCRLPDRTSTNFRPADWLRSPSFTFATTSGECEGSVLWAPSRVAPSIVARCPPDRAWAGAIAAWLGSGSALLASSLFFGVMIVAIRKWKNRGARTGRSGNAASGIGKRSALHPGTRRRCARVILHNSHLSPFAPAPMALLPVIARDQTGTRAGGYGLLSAGFGIGAVIAALLLRTDCAGTLAHAIVTSGFFYGPPRRYSSRHPALPAVAIVGACGAGAAWHSFSQAVRGDADCGAGVGTRDARCRWTRSPSRRPCAGERLWDPSHHWPIRALRSRRRRS